MEKTGGRILSGSSGGSLLPAGISPGSGGGKRRLDRALRAIRIDAVHLLLRDGRIDQLRVGGQHVAGLAGAVQRGLEPDAAVRIPLVAVEHEQLVSGPFVLDEKSRALYKAGQPIALTQVEFQIMELFFRNPGTALVREKILEGVWGENYYGDVKIVDVNIRRLRMKIEDEPSSPAHILTVWGYGYRWNP